MDKILTAAEYLDNTTPGNTWFDNEAKESVVERSFSESAMIEFAKMHVQAALKEADNNAKVIIVDYESGFNESDLPTPIYGVDSSSILNAYPLENIK